ncbi:ABC1 family protein [Scenedesmus sp. PABB004]|nr:ABC1 family protein [Scenedesmus sp. PABB004]
MSLRRGLLVAARAGGAAVRAHRSQLASRELLAAQLGQELSRAWPGQLAFAARRLHALAAGGHAAPAHSAGALARGAARRWQSLAAAQQPHAGGGTGGGWAALEARLVTVVNSLALSPAGQTVLGAFLPITLLAALFPSRVRCRAYELPAGAARGEAYFVPVTARLRQQQAVQEQLLWGLLANCHGAISHALARLGEELAVALRGLYLAALFAPALLTAPLVFRWGAGREAWLVLLRWTLEQAGPAFIKWGQWGSTRPDLFPRDVCKALEALQSNAPSHAPAHSVAAVEAAFGRPLGELFAAWEAAPIASGSIAQIHRARLSHQAAASAGVPAGTLVAVKVRHPGVGTLMARDFVLMQRAARAAGLVPGLAALRLDESVRQFGGPLQEQLDLSVEAAHLDRFARNFKSWRNVKFPTPIHPLVRPDVLVESFEPGAAINGYVAASAACAAKAAMAALADGGGSAAAAAALPACGGSSGPALVAAAADATTTCSLASVTAHAQRRGENESLRVRGAIAETGMHAYLKMLLADNFIHADMHPGNILVREVDRSGGIAERFALLLKQLSWGLPLPGLREVFRNVVMPPTPQLVLLDTGMIAELSKADQTSVVQFFRALTKQDGGGIARSILAMSEMHTCPDPERFVSCLAAMFEGLDPEVIRTRTSEVLQDMIEQLRQHQVTLKATVSTVVVTTLVLEGWSRELNPDLHIMDTLRDMLAVDWKERLGRAVDKVMASGSLAVV